MHECNLMIVITFVLSVKTCMCTNAQTRVLANLKNVLVVDLQSLQNDFQSKCYTLGENSH